MPHDPIERSPPNDVFRWRREAIERLQRLTPQESALVIICGERNVEHMIRVDHPSEMVEVAHFLMEQARELLAKHPDCPACTALHDAVADALQPLDEFTKPPGGHKVH